MIIYIIIGTILSYFRRKYDIKCISGKGPYFFIWFFLILLVGFQYKMGGDNLSYEEDFIHAPDLRGISFSDLVIGSRFQPLWIIFLGFTKSIYNSYTCFHLIHALFIDVIIAYLFYKTTNCKFTATLLFFITFEFWIFNIDLQRESLAVAMFCLSYFALRKNKYIVYYILSFIGFLFHASAAMLFIIPPIYYLYKVGKIKILLIVFVTIVSSFTFIREYILGFGVIENINQQVTYYSELEVNRTNALILALFTCIPFFIFIKLRKFDTTNSDFFLFCTILYCAFTISNVFDSISFRFCNYMFPFVMVYIASVSCSTAAKYKKWVYLAYMFLFIIYVYKYTLPAPFIGPNARMYEVYIPYKSILFN